jgi:eukaryotic-like serine/threonine-protein kinase
MDQTARKDPALQIPGYQILEKVGQGTMGVVYKARQLSVDRLVAVKVLLPRLAGKKAFVERFLREARLAARFTSSHAVQVIDVGSAGALPYFVMEYVEGTTVRRELEKGKVYAEPEALKVVFQVAQVLRQAHRRNLIHRDVKPGNIMLTSGGLARLADLGLAREVTDRETARAEKGLALGTPYYMAPEQIEAREDVDTRADIYSLGATLYHMVTGRPPFPGGTVDEILDAHLEQELTPPDHLNRSLSPGLSLLVQCMMARDPHRRYQTPDQLIGDLERVLAGEPPELARDLLAAGEEDLEFVEEERERGEAGEDETGEDDEEEEEEEEEHFLNREVPISWLLVVLGFLALSLVFNMVLLFR